MNWLAITIVAYFLLALEVILNKFLLSSKRISHPVIYAFYSGLIGLSVIFLVPFGFHAISLYKIIFSFITGIVFIYGMLALFFAIKKGEASRVLPVIGATIPIITLFLGVIFLRENLGFQGILGILVLILGGLLISFNLTNNKSKIFFNGFGFSILSGALLAFSFILIKALYNEDNFLNVFIWTRGGAFIGALTFFFPSFWRKPILSSLFKFKKPQHSEKKSGLLFVLAKILGGCGSILKEKATSIVLASVTVVNALVSIEYVFIFILSLLFSAWVPEVMREKRDLKNILQKIVAIFIIGLGLALVYRI